MENDINTQLNELESNSEKIDFLLQCVPFIKEYTSTEEEKKTTTRFNGINKTGINTKGDVYKRFRNKVFNGIETTESICIFNCIQCNSINVYFVDLTSERFCDDCGFSEIIDGEELSYKEEQEMDKTIVYSYKKENHLNEWICQFQAKESTTVPQKIIDDIKQELTKQKIKNKNDITHTKVKEILKKLNYNKYYDHAPYITQMVNGIKPPTMPQELEDRIRLMFHQIQAPFEKYRPKDRTNFLSYSYILYKFCELLGEDKYLPCFPLLKSNEKLYLHDQIWKKITNELRWQYIPTI